MSAQSTRSVLRTSDITGGGGINVARVIHELGGQALAVYLSGGVTGPLFDSLFGHLGIAQRRIPIEDHTRISHVVYERASGLEYRFVPEGPTIQESEWTQCLDTLSALEFDYLVASGSLPPSVPPAFYAMVAELADRKGARVILDTSGEALRRALTHGVYLVKPSLGEFQSLVDNPVSDPGSQEREARTLVATGAAQVVAVTMGHAGALLATEAGILRLAPPQIQAKSAVGAGDSFVGAMTLAIAQGWSVERAFIYGIATGAAAVSSLGTELCKRPDVERLFTELYSGSSIVRSSAGR